MHVSSFGWHSLRVNRHMEFLRFGHAGAPVVVFPTPEGNQTEFAERGMIDALAWKIDQGLLQVYCIDSNDRDGWYNSAAAPRRKVELSVAFEDYIVQEFLPHLRRETGSEYLILTGMSFGAYHAVNFALKHPQLVDRVVSLSGSFTIREFLDGYNDDLCYFNDPVSYLPNLSDAWYLSLYNTHTDITLVSSIHDFCLERSVALSEQFRAKSIRHNLAVWQGDYTHDWPAWRAMIPTYL